MSMTASDISIVYRLKDWASVKLKALDYKFTRFVQKRIRQFRMLRSATFSLRNAFLGFGVALGATGLAKAFTHAASTVEQMRTALGVMMGGVSKANTLFDQLRDYARKVPWTLEDIMGAAVQLTPVFKGGAEEMKKWLPLLSDLSGLTQAFGMSFTETVNQFRRAVAGGMPKAIMFVRRGVAQVLGFMPKTEYTAEQTRKKLIEEWQKVGSLFSGMTEKMRVTWKGKLSMMADAWFDFRVKIMESGVFEGMKAVLDEGIKSMRGYASTATETGNSIMDMFIALIKVGHGLVMLPKTLGLAWNAFNMAVEQATANFTQSMGAIRGKLGEALDATWGKLPAAVRNAMAANNPMLMQLNMIHATAKYLEKDFARMSTAAQSAADASEDKVRNMAAEIDNAEKKLGHLVIKLQAIAKDAKRKAAIKALAEEMKQVFNALETLEMKYGSTMSGKVGDRLVALLDKLDKLEEKLRTSGASTKQVEQLMLAAEKAGRSLAHAADEKERLLSAGKGDEDKAVEKTEKAGKAVKKLQATLSWSNQLIYDQVQNIGNAVQNSLVSAWDNLLDKTQTWISVLKNFLRDLSGQLLRTLSSSLLKLGMGLLQGALAGDGGASSMQALAGGITKTAGGFFTSAAKGGVFPHGLIPSFAGGGWIARGPQLAMIGDNRERAETVLPLRRGRGGRLGVEASGGGGTTVVNQHFTIQAMDGADVHRVLTRHRNIISSLAAQNRYDNPRNG